ncbi:MAG: hypothetical protein MH204_01545, partial [Fimbriimonadaceae bacterium]|nr:hypothetical protein [Fimbriimonadaceae bacterium]
MILLTPGPCMTAEEVRQAAALPDLNHRDPDFRLLSEHLRTSLARLAPGCTPFIFSGSGTTALEAMATSCVERGPVLLVANGIYSERMADIFAAHEIPHEVLNLGWLEPFDLDRVERALAS